MERLCLFCKNFRLTPGCEGYSTMTPGWVAELECVIGKNEFDLFDMSGEDEYRERMLFAQTCDSYEVDT